MYRGNDILKIYDQDLNNIGRATREKVHTKGLLHQVAHVWMFQPVGDDTFIMIQKRSLDRELYPGKYDLIQTTHFDPDESYEEAIVDSLEYYRGLKKSKEDIIHVGSTHQQIDAGDYHDNALVQVFAIFTAKALFIMPDTEEIVKVRFEDFRQFIHGKQNHTSTAELKSFKILSGVFGNGTTGIENKTSLKQRTPVRNVSGMFYFL